MLERDDEGDDETSSQQVFQSGGYPQRRRNGVGKNPTK